MLVNVDMDAGGIEPQSQSSNSDRPTSERCAHAEGY